MLRAKRSHSGSEDSWFLAGLYRSSLLIGIALAGALRASVSPQSLKTNVAVVTFAPVNVPLKVAPSGSGVPERDTYSVNVP